MVGTLREVVITNNLNQFYLNRELLLISEGPRSGSNYGA